jgi:hypothetical protein
LLGLLLCILHHDYVLGDAIYLYLILGHIIVQGDHVDGVELSTVGIKEGHDAKPCVLCIKGLGILEALVTNLVSNVTEKLATPCLAAL